MAFHSVKLAIIAIYGSSSVTIDSLSKPLDCPLQCIEVDRSDCCSLVLGAIRVFEFGKPLALKYCAYQFASKGCLNISVKRLDWAKTIARPS